MESDAKSDWRPKIKDHIFRVLLAALGGAFVLSAGYIPTVPKRVQDIQREAKYALEQQNVKFSNARAFVDLTSEAVITQCGARAKSFVTLDYWKKHLPADEKTRNEIHIKSGIARVEAADDLGRLNSYSPATTGLPNEYHKAATDILEAEIRLWESLDNLVDTAKRHARNSPEADDAIKSFSGQFVRFTGAFSAFESSYKQLPSLNKAADLARKHIIQTSMDAIDDVQLWHNLARVGFWGSTLGFLVVGVLAFRRRASSSQRRENKRSHGDTLDAVVVVFQYGSNCSAERLNGRDRLNGQAAPVGIAQTVEEYQLAFDVWSDGNKCAAADIVNTPGKRVWGVLYEVPNDFVGGKRKDKKKTLEQIEGRRYKRIPIRVRDRERQEREAITFVARERERRTDIATSTAYVTWIIKGLREHGVSEDYIREVKEIAAANNPGIKGEIAHL